MNNELILPSGWEGPYTSREKEHKKIITFWRNTFMYSKSSIEYQEKSVTRRTELKDNVSHIVISASENHDTSLFNNGEFIIPNSVSKLSIQGSNVKIPRIPKNIKHIKFYDRRTVQYNLNNIYLWPDNIKYEYILQKKPITHHNVIHTEKYTINHIISLIKTMYIILPLPIYEEIVSNYDIFGNMRNK